LKRWLASGRPAVLAAENAGASGTKDEDDEDENEAKLRKLG
jgi:hypothetical protein